MTLHPLRYAELLREKMNKHQAPAYLVNTGWVGASAQSGAKRISLPVTRAIIHAILDGSINDSEFEVDPYFGILVPKTLGDIDASLLIPKNIWADEEAYRSTAMDLVNKFQDNFTQYDLGDEYVRDAGPSITV